MFVRVKVNSNQEYEGRFKAIENKSGNIAIANPFEIIRKSVTIGQQTKLVQFKKALKK